MGQVVRITYLQDSSTKPKRLTGRVESVSSDAIVVTYNPGFKDKDVSISFEHIKKIELIKMKISPGEYMAGTIFALALFFTIYIKIELDKLD